jgi:hypothetical protein
LIRELKKKKKEGISILSHSLSVTTVTLGSRLFFNSAANKLALLASGSNEIPEEYGHFRFLRAACLANIKGSVGLILAKASVMRISIPLDLSSGPL